MPEGDGEGARETSVEGNVPDLERGRFAPIFFSTVEVARETDFRKAMFDERPVLRSVVLFQWQRCTERTKKLGFHAVWIRDCRHAIYGVFSSMLRLGRSLLERA